MRFSLLWRKKMKKSDREKLKKMTLSEFKQKYPKLVENIRSQERAKLYGKIQERKQRIKELKELKRQTSAKEEKEIKELNERYNTLLARKAELILKEQDYEHKALIKKKLKNMSGSLKEILIPLLFGCSSAEDMDKKIEEVTKLYEATHPSESIGQSERKDDWPKVMTEEEKKADLDQKFKKAFE